MCAGCNGSFEATITTSARWGESSLANAHEAERTTGGATSGIRVRNFDDGELAELRVIYSSVYKTIDYFTHLMTVMKEAAQKRR